MNLQRLALGAGGRIGLGQIGGGPVVDQEAVDIVHGLRLHALGTAQRGVVLRSETVTEIAVVYQVAHLERVGDGDLHRGRRLGSRRGVQVGKDPLLLDGVDAVDQPPLGGAQVEDQAFEPQNLLRVALAVVRFVVQAMPHAAHDAHDRILTHLQLRIAAQQRHVLLVALQPRNAGLHGRLLRNGLPAEKQRGKRQKRYAKSTKHRSYLHHLMKKS